MSSTGVGDSDRSYLAAYPPGARLGLMEPGGVRGKWRNGVCIRTHGDMAQAFPAHNPQ
jgi:hypothetical protein